MDKQDAISRAEQLLEVILENQPHLFQAHTGSYVGHPEQIANFCNRFIEVTAENILKRSQG